jgi:hypothetical protein
MSFKSIYIAQGDIGFMQYRNKNYGMFLIFVQTYTGHIAVIPIPNKKRESLLKGFESLLKVSFYSPPPPFSCFGVITNN